MVCLFLTVLAMVVIGLGFLVLIGSIVVTFAWLIILAIALFASGGPAAAAFAQSWPILLIAFGVGFVAFIFISLGYLLLLVGSAMCSRSGTSGMSGLMAGPSLSNLFPSFGALLGGGGLPDFGGIPLNSPLDLLRLLLLPPDQRAKLPPNILGLLDCFRACLCRHLCDGTHDPGRGTTPGEIVIDVGNQLLEDLKHQLAEAQRTLEELRNQFPPPPPDTVLYWSRKVEELTKRIIALGGQP